MGFLEAILGWGFKITLQGWLRMSTLEQSLGQRARRFLLLAEGGTPMAICGQLQITSPVERSSNGIAEVLSFHSDHGE